MGKIQHFQLLLWKNFVIQKRHPIATIVQIVVPVVLVTVLVLIRLETDSITHHPASTYSSVAEGECFLRTDNSYRRDAVVRVTYAPNNTITDQVMDRFRKRYQAYLSSELTIKGFVSEEELVDFAVNGLNISVDAVSIVFVGVNELKDFSGDITFKIRFPLQPQKSAFGPKDDWMTRFTFPTVQNPGPRNPNIANGGSPDYCDKGFISVQHEVAMSIANVLQPERNDSVSLSIKRFPYPAYYEDSFLIAIRNFLPLLIMLSFLYPAFDLVKNLVLEKERRLTESMKIMGLSSTLHWTSWFTKSMIFFTINTVLITILLSYNFGSVAVLAKSDGTLVFVFLMLYVICGICFCFLLSTLFSKANSAATAAGVLWFMAYFPYFFLQSRYYSMTFLQKILACLLINTCMAFGCMQVALNEGTGFGLQWNLAGSPINADDNFSMANVMVMLVVDSFLYLIVTWYVSTVFPGEFGMPQPWYFPFLKRYWCRGRDNISSDLRSTEQMALEYFEDEPLNMKPGVKICGLTKVFDKTKVAVNNLNLNMFEGQITVLLGHNGAGKTTTMSMLTGLFPPSCGDAFINGYSIHENLEGVRSNLGLCPQFNVLFDDLTVEEHLYFACKLKQCDSNVIRSEINSMLAATNLLDKRRNLSNTLSGGMKRRLCVGMAFVGGSKVVMLDEPTSGMDPTARRFTWDLLQAQSKNRTILLTTHFMDEADILGDRIAIMANGQLQCCGTPMFLKKKYGAGYHLILVKEPGCNVEIINAMVTGIIPKAELESNVGAELSFVLPHNSTSQFSNLFSQIEHRKQQLKVSSYGASVTTMEEVFLRVGEQSDASVKKLGLDSANGNSTYRHLDDSPNLNASKISRETFSMTMNQPLSKMRNSGLKLVLQQFWAMFVKRMLHTKRNWVLMLAQFMTPIGIMIICLTVLNTTPSDVALPSLVLDLKPFGWSKVVFSNDSDTGNAIAALYASQFTGTTNTLDPSVNKSSFDEHMLMIANEDTYDYNMHYVVGASFSESSRTPGQIDAMAWFNNQPYHGLGISVVALDTALLRYYTNNENLHLTVINHPLPMTFEDKSQRKDKHRWAEDMMKDTMTGFQVAFNAIFGISFLVSSFVIFLVKEKSCDAKHLQFVSGVRAITFWGSTFAWDFVNFILPCLGVMLLFVIYSQDGYSQASVQGALFVLFCAYGCSVLPFTYLCSFLFSVASTAYSRVIMFNIFSGVITVITVSILSMLQDMENTTVLLDWLFLALPNYCMGGALMNIYTNYYGGKMCSLYPVLESMCSCDEIFCLRHTSNYLSWKAPGIGRNVVFLFIWCVVYFLLLMVVEMGLGTRFMSFLYSWKLKYYRPVQGQVNPANSVNALFLHEDDDVVMEKERIHAGNLRKLYNDNILLMKDLTKYYGLFKPFLAVDRLCVGVPGGECFGLLGINGAGKTTTFKMLTGDEMISDGDAYVTGLSVRRQITSVRHHLGYCPQFDAVIEQMTGRETLTMFARLRGIPEVDLPFIVDKLSSDLLFTEHIDKLVKNYSGGNKRKLSTAVALIGDPPIVFLDEPTTGMDPLARRYVWNTISRVRDNGSSIILTSHSMEECDALCTRLTIMVNGVFMCLGSPQHLKNKFGKGYTLTAKVHQGDNTFEEVTVLTKSLQDFIMKTFPGCTLKDEHHGMVHYHIPTTVMSWAKIFDVLENAKHVYHLEDYAIGQTTLEQVFLNFTKQQQGRSDE